MSRPSPGSLDIAEQLHELSHVFKNRLRRITNADISVPILQARILSYLATHPRSTQQNLADYNGRDKAQMTRVLQEMEQRGWVKRDADAYDRRTLRLVLTEDGLRYARIMAEKRHRVACEMLQHVSAEDQMMLIRMLTVMTSNLLRAADVQDAARHADATVSALHTGECGLTADLI